MSHSTDLRFFFDDYTSGRISTENLQALEAALREDAELRRDFIEYMNVDSVLGDLAAVSDTEAEAIENEATSLQVGNSASLVTKAAASERTFYRVAAVVGTLAASLLFGVILLVTNRSDDQDAPVAMLVTEVDAALMRRGKPWEETALPTGEYRLDQGLLHLRFAGGVMVYVEAPARFDVVHERRIELFSGRLSANVPPEGIGFTVETTEAQIVDYGTEFSVEAESGASEVHVFEGLVRVHSRYATNQESNAIDLRTSEAIRIEDSPQSSVAIRLASERFIRNFEEPKRNYARSVKQLSPVAYYRMPIRDRGLISEPPEYSGQVLTGDGNRPPHARGVFTGGSLRVRADSTGRGGRVDSPPPLGTGQFTLAVFVYLETRATDGTVATNIVDDEGNFALSLDENGLLRATVRTSNGEFQSVASEALLPLTTWRHLVMTADGEQLRIYEDGQLVAGTPCVMTTTSESEAVWFGTGADGSGLWDGRIDELALFDRALSGKEIAALYQAAREEMVKPE